MADTTYEIILSHLDADHENTLNVYTCDWNDVKDVYPLLKHFGFSLNLLDDDPGDNDRVSVLLEGLYSLTASLEAKDSDITKPVRVKTRYLQRVIINMHDEAIYEFELSDNSALEELEQHDDPDFKQLYKEIVLSKGSRDTDSESEDEDEKIVKKPVQKQRRIAA